MRKALITQVLAVAMGVSSRADVASHEPQARLPEACTPMAPTGLLTDTRSPRFDWAQAQEATWHQVWLNRGQQTHLSKWVPSNTPWSATNLPAGDYRWWVRGWNPIGYGPWSAGADFTIPPVTPGECGPLAPMGAVAETRRPQFRWTAAAHAAWYRLWIGTEAGRYYERWVQGATEWTPAWDLPPAGYAWWVRGWNADGDGPWSGKAEFTVGVPGNCGLLAPTGTVTETRRPPFAWEVASQATWYRLWINKAGAKYYETWVQGITGWTPAWDLPSDDYESWVRPWNPDGYGAWSAGVRFRVQDRHFPLGTDHDFGSNNPNRYVVLGDSISAPETDGVPCWPTRLAMKLGKDVVNLAVDGELAAEGAPRTPGVLSEHQPGFLLVLYGANDVIRGRQNRSTVENLRFIARAAKRNKTIPVLATLTPMTGSHAAFADAVDQLNILILQMARQESVPVVHLDLVFGYGLGLLIEDGLHPNATGKQVIAQAFCETLN